MKKNPLPRIVRCLFVLAATAYLVACQGLPLTGPTTPRIPPSNPDFKGVLMWKGDPSETGLDSAERNLTAENVNVSQFGKWGDFLADGIVMGQPLYVSQLDMGAAGTRNYIIFATENDSVYAVDADNPGGPALWERQYVDPANGVTTMVDSFGGRTT